MRKTLAALILVLSVPVRAGSSPEVFPLRGMVLGERGSPLAGVEVEMLGSGAGLRAVSGDNGEFAIDAPEGSYRLRFFHPDYYPTTLEDFHIRIVREPERKNPNVELRVLLTRRLAFELDLLVQGPKFVDPPPLKVTFALKPPPALYQPVAGELTVRNMGDEPVMIPLRPEQDSGLRYSPQTLLMQVQVEIKEQDALYDEPYLCQPSIDCGLLGPGESVSIPVRLLSRSGYAAGLREPKVYQEEGSLQGEARLYFVLPEAGPQPTYTRNIQTTFTADVR